MTFVVKVKIVILGKENRIQLDLLHAFSIRNSDLVINFLIFLLI